MRALALAVVLGMATVQSCFADDAATMRRFGLLGTWAPDCKAQASPNNMRLSFSTTDEGKVRYVVWVGPGSAAARHIVSDVTVIDDHRLTGTFERSDNSVTTFVTLRLIDGKLQSIQSFDATGHYFIRDGHFTSPGAPPAPVEEKCDADQS